jgi:hypothetical protein
VKFLPLKLSIYLDNIYSLSYNLTASFEKTASVEKNTNVLIGGRMRIAVILLMLVTPPAWGQKLPQTSYHGTSIYNLRPNYLYLGILNNADDNLVIVTYSKLRDLRNGYSIGLSGGLTNYPKAMGFPLFGEIRKRYETQPVPMFIYADLGYTVIKLSNDSGFDHGGVMLNAGLSTRVRLSDGCGLVFNLGYFIQKGERIEERLGYEDIGHRRRYYYYAVTEKVTYDFIAFSIGLNY